jgi:hypothetical protein
VLSHIRPGQTVVIPETHNAAAWEAPVVKTPLPLWELSHQSRLVIPIQTPRLTVPGGTTRRCSKAVSRRNPWPLMHPHQRHGHSLAILIEDGVSTPVTYGLKWVIVTPAREECSFSGEFQGTRSTKQNCMKRRQKIFH